MTAPALPGPPAALAGVRVVDLSHLIAGPLCTMLMADAGAEVIKVEPPAGDRARHRGAELARGDAGVLSGYHSAYNRGKQSLCVDLKQPAGQQVLSQLLEQADVLVENFSPGVLDRLGFGLAGLRTRFPSLVTVSIGVYPPDRRSGPASLKRGLALVAEAESGIASLTGAPADFGFQLGDQVTGLYAYAAVMNALYHRSVTGEATHVDVSMIGSLIAANASAVANYSLAGLLPADFPNALYGYFATSDGYIAVGLSTDEQWARLVAAVDDPVLRDAAGMDTYTGRNAQRGLIESRVARWAAGRSAAAAVAALDEARIPCGRANSVSDLVDSGDDAYLCTVSDAYGNQVRVPRNPIGQMFGVPLVPELGQHSQAILADVLHLDQAQIDRLVEDEVVRGGRKGDELA